MLTECQGRSRREGGMIGFGPVEFLIMAGVGLGLLVGLVLALIIMVRRTQ